MILEIVIPTENTYTLLLPDEFIGKKVEVIAFALEEVATNTEIPQANPAQRRAHLDEILKNYTFNSGGYKFDRKGANDYE